MVFICPECQKQFRSNRDFTRHQQRKYPCTSRQYEKVDDYYKCPHCVKQYKHSNNLTRHYKTCPGLKAQEEFKRLNREQYEELKSAFFQLQDEFMEFKRKQSMALVPIAPDDIPERYLENKSNEIEQNRIQTNQIQANHIQSHNKLNSDNKINSDNHIQNNIIQITLNPFGKEDISHITDDVIKRIAAKGFASYAEMMRLIHFNKDKPANHNLLVDTKYNKRVIETYNGDGWQSSDEDRIIEKIVHKSYKLLKKRYEEMNPDDAGYLASKNIQKEIDNDCMDAFQDDIFKFALAQKFLPEEMKKRWMQLQKKQSKHLDLIG